MRIFPNFLGWTRRDAVLKLTATFIAMIMAQNVGFQQPYNYWVQLAPPFRNPPPRPNILSISVQAVLSFLS